MKAIIVDYKEKKEVKKIDAEKKEKEKQEVKKKIKLDKFLGEDE